MTDTNPAAAYLTDTEQLCALLEVVNTTARQLWAFAQDRKLPHELQTHAHATADHAERAIRAAEAAGLVAVTRERDKTIRSIDPAGTT